MRLRENWAFVFGDSIGNAGKVPEAFVPPTFIFRAAGPLAVFNANDETVRQSDFLGGRPFSDVDQNADQSVTCSDKNTPSGPRGLTSVKGDS